MNTAYKARGKGKADGEYRFGVQGRCVWLAVVCGYQQGRCDGEVLGFRSFGHGGGAFGIG